MEKNLKFLVKEMIPVFIGVLIALFINNWNEDRKDEKYFSEIINSIELELNDTQEDIQEEIISQKSLIDTLVFYLDDDMTSLQGIMNKTNGVTMPKIKIHSWKALSNSKIELLDYENLSNLAEIEEEKDNLREKTKYLMNFIYSNIAEKSRLKKAILIGLISDIISTENWISSEIDEFNERLKASS